MFLYCRGSLVYVQNRGGAAVVVVVVVVEARLLLGSQYELTFGGEERLRQLSPKQEILADVFFLLLGNENERHYSNYVHHKIHPKTKQYRL